MEQRSTRSFWDKKVFQPWETRPWSEEDFDHVPWATFRFLNSLLPRLAGKAVLELGCGSGWLTPYLASACDQLVALDFSAPALEVAAVRCRRFSNVTFVQADILDFAWASRFDVVAGRMVLHEVMHGDVPRLLDQFDRLLAPCGFIYFHENSYFNLLARVFRSQCVGRYGIPKHGSEDELPFDAARFELYRRHFQHAERFVEGVELAQKIYDYVVPIKEARVARACLSLDKGLTAINRRSGLLRNWSYAQTIYASHALPRKEAFSPAPQRLRHP
jgi:SAM-dependent methyltransferase